MVKFSDVQEDDDEYNSKTFRGYKKYKEYKKKLEQNSLHRPSNAYVEQKYFSCISCGKINMVEDIIKEETENRTMRAKYYTWKKFKDISNEVGGSLENGLLYLMSLHEGIVPNQIVSDEREIGIAGFGGGEEREEDKQNKKGK